MYTPAVGGQTRQITGLSL